jgi:hypothetical protein
MPPGVLPKALWAWRFAYAKRHKQKRHGWRFCAAQGIEAEFGRKAAKLERIARFLAQKSAFMRIFALCFAKQNNKPKVLRTLGKALLAPCFFVPPSITSKNAPLF